ncbi:MAG: UDP-4-amino-4,6-dideoxy-N-acetyl-beta-L-altrosamine transaminase [Patescibacteria group bacterium]|nr:UDP-4-amino-4,6-dideoxy-N-acetyl-beta-L-altrosamine transaminase [Patescibacteria group bacterium]
MIPYSRQSIGSDDIRAVAKVLRAPYITQGPKIEEFERVLAKYTGARYCIVFSSGTAALHAAYFAAGVGKGDEVIVPALTFAATGNAALYLGAKPVFADIEPETGNIDPKDAGRKITKKTKAVVAVDYAGLPADLGAMRRLAKKHGLVFIEDSAQGLGARYKVAKVGALADMTMFSFHPVKSITTGEGGAITTDDKTYYERLLMFRSHGLTRDPKKLKEKKHAAWHQEMQLLGYNYRLTDMQSALGISQMKKLNGFLAKRKALAKRYRLLLKGLEHFMLPSDVAGRASAWHLFVVRVRSSKRGARDRVFNAMRKAGIGVQVHYLPVYLHPYYRALGYKKGLCPEAEKFAESAISIPIFPNLTLRDQSRVTALIKKIDGEL